MSTEYKNQDADTEQEDGVEKEEATETESDTVTLNRNEYDKLNRDLGSLKRELKDLKKPKEEPKQETPKNQSDDNQLLQKLERLSLRQAGIDHPDDVELARKTAKKWNTDIDEVLADEDFKVKLERQQRDRANTEATSEVKGSSGPASKAKADSAYWIAKGVPPTAEDVPDRKTRAKIAREMASKAKTSGKTFYND